MLQQANQAESRDLEWICEGVSPTDAIPATLQLVTIAQYAASGSVRSTPKTKLGIPALSNRVKRVAKANNQNCG